MITKLPDAEHIRRISGMHHRTVVEAKVVETNPVAVKPKRRAKRVTPVALSEADRTAFAYLSRLELRAQRKSLAFDLDLDWVKERLALTHCERTGIAFVKAARHPWSMTIDRRDNSIGYTKENCQAVVWIYNCAKSTFTEDQVIHFAAQLLAKSNIESNTSRHDADARRRARCAISD